ncbi:hypothetical protein O3M35_007537 [Rhynocoris fuscipes]|uniref:Uncharacterized protein n=1 Tax=Rhynocoris fuscipes TaxID=488301 RepID=A0AAW1DF25_9HEMI
MVYFKFFYIVYRIFSPRNKIHFCLFIYLFIYFFELFIVFYFCIPSTNVCVHGFYIRLYFLNKF